MRHSAMLLGAIGLAGLAAVTARAETPALERFAWLAGCWQVETGESGTGEIWMRPVGGAMFGVARTLRGGRTVAHEFMQIREAEGGRLVYIALPAGQAETTFTSVKVSATEVIFENPGHDFPQRVIYRLRPDGGLAARIEGRLDGVERSMDYPMLRVRCEDEPPADPAGD